MRSFGAGLLTTFRVRRVRGANRGAAALRCRPHPPSADDGQRHARAGAGRVAADRAALVSRLTALYFSWRTRATRPPPSTSDGTTGLPYDLRARRQPYHCASPGRVVVCDSAHRCCIKEERAPADRHGKSRGFADRGFAGSGVGIRVVRGNEPVGLASVASDCLIAPAHANATGPEPPEPPSPRPRDRYTDPRCPSTPTPSSTSFAGPVPCSRGTSS